MSDKIFDSSKLLSSGNITPNHPVFYKKSHFGALFDVFKSREKEYILYSYIFFFFFSLGIILFEHLPSISFADNLSHLFNFSFLFSFYIEAVISSFLILIFSFTIYSRFINYIFLFYIGYNLGCYSCFIINDNLIKYIIFFSLFSFLLIIYSTESVYFSRSIIKSGLNFSRVNEIISYLSHFILYIFLLSILFWGCYYF